MNEHGPGRKDGDLRSRWGRILDNSFDEIYIFSAEDYRFIHVSRGALRNLGYSIQEMTRLTPLDLKPGIDLPQFERLISPLREGRRELVVFETHHRRKDGSLYPVEVRLQLAAEETPEVFIAIILDITERKRSESALKESERRYHTLAQVSPVGIFRTDVDGNCIYVNERWCELAGMDGNQALGEGWAAALHPDDRERLFAEWYGAAREKRPFRAECRFRRPDGTITWLLAQAAAERDEQGEVIGYVGTITDITTRKRTENAIHQIAAGVSADTGRRFFRQMVLSLAQLFDADHAFIGLLEKEGRATIDTLAVCSHGGIVDNFSYKIEGTPCAEIIGRGTRMYLDHVQRLFPDASLLAELDAESFIGTPLFDSAGQPMGLVAILDSKPMVETEQMGLVLEIFTVRIAAEIERMRAETLVRNQRDHLEELVKGRTAELMRANKELEAFSYSVSHDLRSPLRAIDGFAHALLEDYSKVLDDTGKDYLNRVRAASQRMGRLIDDLLELSRVGRSEFQRAAVRLDLMAREIVAKLEEADPGHKVEVSIAPDMRAQGDRRLLRIVLDNLLGNAWKYTRKTESARIEFGLKEDGAEKVFFVRDNGAGFDMQYADKLFGAFQRLHKPEEFQGSGIGLATVERIVHRHGGRVWAESEPGKGAVFCFTLPEREMAAGGP